jgi:hypothetical protein
MAEDLAIDVGIPNDSDEFETFVSCVNNILDHGCGYSEEVTAQICEKCETSELPIAKKVLRECRRVRQNTGRLRPSKLKWWETWRSKHESAVPRWPGRSPSPAPRPKRPPRVHRKKKLQPMFEDKRGKRPMSPMFKGKRGKRPMSPMFKGKRCKRPMSPMFEDRRAPQPMFNGKRPRFDRHRPHVPRASDRYNSDNVSYERRPENSTRKRRRYR